MTLKLLTVLLAASLTLGCGRSATGVRPGSVPPDAALTQLVSNAETDLAPRYLSNGQLACADKAATELAQDQCLGDVEDLALAAETDKAVALANLRRGVQRVRLALTPCGFWRRLVRAQGCRVQPAPGTTSDASRD